MKNVIITFFFLLSIIINLNCTSFVEKDRRVFIVLIDYSASNNDLVLQKYISIINETIFANMQQFDCLIVVPIDEGAKMEPVKLVYENLAEKKFTQPKDGFAHANDSLKLRFANYVSVTAPEIEKKLKTEKIERKKFTFHTDIFGAIQQTTNLIEYNSSKTGAAKDIEDFVLGHVRLKSENIIVVLSDMIQNTPECSFNLKKGFKYQNSSRYVEQLKQQGKVPDLKDCKVFVIGATGQTPTQVDNVAMFWKEYFRQTNAELKAYGYNVEDKLRRYLKESAD